MRTVQHNDWNVAVYGRGLENGAPVAPGVYVIADVKREFGLPTQMDIIYVGRSVDLRRRFSEHVHAYRESNPSLDRLHDHREGLEFWYRVALRADLGTIEQELIQRLQPPANRVGLRPGSPAPKEKRPSSSATAKTTAAA